MKKSLLTFGMVMATTAVFAFQAPTVHENHSFQHISPNGEWVVSDMMGDVVIINTVSGQKWEYRASDDGSNNYSSGLGNSISNTGVILGSTLANNNAAYWVNGEWKELNIPAGAEDKINLSSAITPDAKRICGAVGVHSFGMDDVTMIVPAIWDQTADGSYGDAQLLPCPKTDFSGRAPQYITANAISADGKVIAGQIVDCAGFIRYPIVYTQAADGKWSYTVLGVDAINPDNLQFPEYPGNSPAQPNYEEFMTEEQLAAYNQAVMDFYMSTEDIPFPKYVDYMSADKAAEFTAAMAAYEEALAAWSEKNDAFMAVYEQCQAGAPNYEFNSVYLTPNGKTMYTTRIVEVEDPMSWFGYREDPYIASFDLATGAVTTMEQSMNITAVANDNTILAGINIVSLDAPAEGYIIREGVITPILDYIQANGEEMAAWINENLKEREYEGYVENEQGEWDVVLNKADFSGMTIASEDLKTMAMWHQPIYAPDFTTVGFIFKLEDNSGIKNVSVAGANVRIDADGNVVADENVASVEVYNIAGARVSGKNLGKGMYIAKGVRADGTPYAVKLVK